MIQAKSLAFLFLSFVVYAPSGIIAKEKCQCENGTAVIINIAGNNSDASGTKDTDLTPCGTLTINSCSVTIVCDQKLSQLFSEGGPVNSQITCNSEDNYISAPVGTIPGVSEIVMQCSTNISSVLQEDTFDIKKFWLISPVFCKQNDNVPSTNDAATTTQPSKTGKTDDGNTDKGSPSTRASTETKNPEKSTVPPVTETTHTLNTGTPTDSPKTETTQTPNTQSPATSPNAEKTTGAPNTGKTAETLNTGKTTENPNTGKTTEDVNSTPHVNPFSGSTNSTSRRHTTTTHSTTTHGAGAAELCSLLMLGALVIIKVL